MTFAEQLNEYIKQIGCSSKELVIVSGLTSSVISRYRKGERSPSIKSKQLDQLTEGLYKLFNDKNINEKHEKNNSTIDITYSLFIS